MRRTAVILPAAALASALLSGCIAKTALDIATAPVRIASGAVDAVTTSQSEADEKRGRAIRQREERLGQLDRQYAKLRDRCAAGREDACEAARATYADMAALRTDLPPDPE